MTPTPPESDAVTCAKKVLALDIRDGDIYCWWANAQDQAREVVRLGNAHEITEAALQICQGELALATEEYAKMQARATSAEQALAEAERVLRKRVDNG